MLDVYFLQVFVPLFTAHLLGDFILQRDLDVQNKKKIIVFLKHIFILSILSYVLTGIWQDLTIPIVVFVGHLVIDLIKSRIKQLTIHTFLLDQLAHILLLIVLSVYLTNVNSEYYMKETILVEWMGNNFIKICIILTSIILSTKVSGLTIDLILEKIPRKDQNLISQNDSNQTSVKIGMLERLLILVCFLSNVPEVVGFLITAKLILRYGEIKGETERMIIEYMLIGTLLSFTIGVSVGYLTTLILSKIN